MRWRQDGKQTGATFEDAGIANVFKSIVETDGPDAAYAWLESRASGEDDAPSTVWTLTMWMHHYVEHLTGITRGTRAEYLKMYLRTFAPLELGVGRTLGETPVELITRDLVAKAINTLDERLSPKSIANTHGLLSAALQAAAEHPDIPLAANPCRGIRLPSGEDVEDDGDDMVWLSPDPMAKTKPPKVDPKVVPVFTDDELDRLCKACEGRSLEQRRGYAIISLFKDTGMRLSELAGIEHSPTNTVRTTRIATTWT